MEESVEIREKLEHVSLIILLEVVMPNLGGNLSLQKSGASLKSPPKMNDEDGYFTFKDVHLELLNLKRDKYSDWIY